MCTAVAYSSESFYFGRNLDLEYSYEETVTVMPGRFPLSLRNGEELSEHYAVIGIAYVNKGYPLFYDGMNEKGLCVAGLSFPHYGEYPEKGEKKKFLLPFEFIPAVLAKCESVCEARKLLESYELVNGDFSPELPATPLHWLIADGKECAAAEPSKNGIRLFDDPVGVLTNSPPFDFQLSYLDNFLNLTAKRAENRFSDKYELSPKSRGMGAFGLPGDLSSPSRFVKAAFTKLNCIPEKGRGISEMFHILSSVEQQNGCVQTAEEEYEKTVYSSCMSPKEGRYYYTTYYNRQITGVDMTREDLSSRELFTYPLINTERIEIIDRGV